MQIGNMLHRKNTETQEQVRLCNETCLKKAITVKASATF